MSGILVLGGVRSGKSRLAESLVAGCEHVTYVAPGPVPDPDNPADAEWAARVAQHQRSRPSTWATVETADVPRAIREAATPVVLVDCLGTWATRVVDDAGAWDDRDRAEAALAHATADLAHAVHTTGSTSVVLVSNEVGWGVVPAHPSGRLFRDGLGRINQQMAQVCDRVLLVVAGRVLDLSAAPTVDDYVKGPLTP